MRCHFAAPVAADGNQAQAVFSVFFVVRVHVPGRHVQRGDHDAIGQPGIGAGRRPGGEGIGGERLGDAIHTGLARLDQDRHHGGADRGFVVGPGRGGIDLLPQGLEI